MEDLVEQAKAKVRRLKLEYDLLNRHNLNLPPATEPLHYQTRMDESSERKADLNKAKTELEELERKMGRNSQRR